ncbi:hypothetical protein H920_00996 [Fukomys damarensis]|uniref:Uncharacterized protein n=1 Tax=Fukomys damarensis TaxID=885580 RepID=A0A091DZQ7_FUKDA|nr:hypothetical protein H920_00996 [Fukomys damarensis]
MLIGETSPRPMQQLYVSSSTSSSQDTNNWIMCGEDCIKEPAWPVQAIPIVIQQLILAADVLDEDCGISDADAGPSRVSCIHYDPSNL